MTGLKCDKCASTIGSPHSAIAAILYTEGVGGSSPSLPKTFRVFARYIGGAPLVPLRAPPKIEINKSIARCVKRRLGLQN